MIQQLRHAKIAFFDPPTPHHHALSRLFTKTLLRYATLSTNTPSPRSPFILNKKEENERNLFPLSYVFFSTKYQQHKKRLYV